MYRDQTTNQQQYMRALATLWERWVRGWAYPELAAVLADVFQENFLDGFEKVLRALPSNIWQLRGFFEGLWFSANPPKSAALARATGVFPIPAPSLLSAEGRALNMLRACLSEIHMATDQLEGGVQ